MVRAWAGGQHLNAAAIVKLKAPVVVKVGDGGQIDQKAFVMDGLQAFAADQAVVIGQHNHVIGGGGGRGQQGAGGGQVGHLGSLRRVARADRGFHTPGPPWDI